MSRELPTVSRLFGAYQADDLSMNEFDIDIAAALICMTAIFCGAMTAYAFGTGSAFVLQKAGGFLALMGGVTIGVPYLSNQSIQVEAGRRLPPLKGSFVIGAASAKFNERREAQRASAIKAVVIERRYAFGMIVLGSVMNTFGDLLGLS